MANPVSEPETVTIIFLGNGGIPEVQRAERYIGDVYGSAQIEWWPAKTNREFIGWVATSSGLDIQVHPTDIVTADSPRVLHARWKELPDLPRSIIVFSGNGGTPMHQQTTIPHFVDVPFAVILPYIIEPVRDGYVFVGWFTSDGRQMLPTDKIEGRILYAHWERITPYTVTFDLAGGTGDFPPVQVMHGETLIRPATNPTREDYSFIGWDFDFATPITGDITITAQWEQLPCPDIAILFWLHGNGRAPALQIGRFGHWCLTRDEIFATVFSQIEPPEREGYTFRGWFTAPEGGTQILPTDAVRDHPSVRYLHAQWVRTLCPACCRLFTSWARPYIQYAYGRGIIVREVWCEDCNDYTFFPFHADATRAIAADLIWRTAGAPAPTNATIPFTDVTANDPFADAVLWAHENGIIRGRPADDGTFYFAPNGTLERRELSTMLKRLAGYFGVDTTNLPPHTWPFFNDHANIGWAEDYIRWNFAVDLLWGDSYRNVHPRRMTERAEAVATVVRFVRVFGN